MKRVLASIVLVALSATCLQAAEELDLVSFENPPATLTVWNRDILTFRATLGGATPEDRLAAVLARKTTIPKFSLYEDVTWEPVYLGGHTGASFHVDSVFLFTLIDSDLDVEAGETLEAAADRAVAQIDEVRTAMREQAHPGVIARGIAFSLLATLVFALALWALKRLQARVRKAMVKQAAGLHWMKFREFDMRAFLLQVLRRLISVVFFLVAVGGVYTWIGVVLARFPYTAPWGSALRGRLLNVGADILRSVLQAIPDLLTVAVIFVVTRWIAQIASGVFKSVEGESKGEGVLSGDTARATRRIAVVGIWIAGVVFAYPYIPGSDSEAFKGIGVLLGLMVSLGSTGLVNQVMSGFVILYSGAVRSGEYAQVGDVEGTVVEISLLSTKVLTPRNEYVTVPNAVLISKSATNYSRLQGDRITELSTTVTIGYDTPWRQVEAMLLQAAQRTPGIRKQPVPHVLQMALSDYYIEYQLRFVPADVSRKNAALSMLHQRIVDTFNEYGVQIMSPHFIEQPSEDLVLPKENWAPPPADQVVQKKKQKKHGADKGRPRQKGAQERPGSPQAGDAQPPEKPAGGGDRPRLP